MTDSQADPEPVVISRPDRRDIRYYIRSGLRNILLAIFWFMTFMMNGDVKPIVMRGFFCGDSSINYPYKQNTISIKTLFLSTLILPGILIHFCDKYFDRLTRRISPQIGHVSKDYLMRRRKTSDAPKADQEPEKVESESEITTLRDKKNSRQSIEKLNSNGVLSSENSDSDDEEVSLFSRIPLDDKPKRQRSKSEQLCDYNRPFSEFQAFLFGFCTTMLLTGIGKVTSGRLRPHFIQRCQPDINCSDASISQKYLEDFNCTNPQLRPRDMSYIRTSWPSGHASVVFFSMFYLIFFLNNVIPSFVKLSPRLRKFRLDPLLMYAIYVGLVGFAGYVAMTRISDYHHHPTDVLSGSILGTLVSIVLYNSLSRRYSQETHIVLS